MVFKKALSILSILFVSSISFSDSRGVSVMITPQEAADLVTNNKAILIDVREISEAQEGMATPAELIPLSKIEANDVQWQNFLKNIKKDKTVIAYCRSGRRSGIVTQKLSDLGITAKNMGGFDSWSKANLPTKKYMK